MDTPNYAAFALPIFAGAILVEVLVAHRRGRLSELYSLGTSISDIGCGAVFQALEVLLTLATLGIYAWMVDHFALVTWAESSPWPWVIGFIAVDFLYYWWHRASHVVNVLWAVHGVHHQSEDYNLAVALRQPVAEPITWFFFYWVLAFVGIPPLVFAICYGANLFYQFWIHTELVSKLPAPIEAVLNTPSHHRVHHGIEEQYLDRNYGGVFVIWDRLFGSFEPEGKRPTYGTTIPLRSYDPLWANAQHLHRTWRLAKAATRWSDKLWVWFAHPAWLPQGVSDPDAKPDRSVYEKYRPAVTMPTVRYIFATLGIIAAVATPFVFVGHSLPIGQILVGAGVLVLCYVVLAGLTEAKSWALPLDWVRIAGLAAFAGWAGSDLLGSTTGLAIAIALAVLSLANRLLFGPTIAPEQLTNS